MIRTISGSRVYAAQEFLNVLYISSGDDGKLYSFDGDTLSVAFTGLSTNIYSLTASSNALFAGTGENGRIYRLDTVNSTALIAHQDSDIAITALATHTFGDKTVVLAGTSSEGKILRTFATEDSFNISYQTTASRINAMRSTDTAVYASIGKSILKLNEQGTWEWQAASDEDILDIAVTDSAIFYITSSGVSRVTSGDEYFTIYLKLIDKAGNESILFDDTGKLVDCRYTSITIDQLSGFITENRILELDEYGNIVYSFAGIDKFYAADKIVSEQGIYDSQIFNGTNDIIKWDRVTWTASEPTGTSNSIPFVIS